MFSSFLNPFFGNLIRAPFSGNPGKIDLMLLSFRIDHNDMNEILVYGGIQALITNRAEKIDTFPFTKFKLGMLKAGIISYFRMQQKQSFFPAGISYPENNVLPDP
jgi:hypothetical protein